MRPETVGDLIQAKGFVYKEVTRGELEQATSQGWEFVDARLSMGFMGPLAVYLVRRPREKPFEIELNEKIASLQGELEKLKLVRREERQSELHFLQMFVPKLQNYAGHLEGSKVQNAKMVVSWLKESAEEIQKYVRGIDKLLNPKAPEEAGK